MVEDAAETQGSASPFLAGTACAVLGTDTGSIQVFAPREQAGVQLRGGGGLEATQHCGKPFLEPLKADVFCQMGASKSSWRSTPPFCALEAALVDTNALSCPFFSFITPQQRLGDQICLLDGT